ncbi:GNAT family N-acetyltransferase [Bradymonas sediminis]|uniref:Uncharacterized protein n=1 Tax=Bradymonas sediminis TaxID=1548548 RepID=A0A2Z4FMT7_9DELT|nr:GNAT family N-acetyltransferase [Bradymonas sediminis]AWV90253.1 hypothetical protein DN745_13305 [Bradymonas sediminis]TDP75778.1 putative GNAT family N-acyltransferase [Bradymonas sediminis]
MSLDAAHQNLRFERTEAARIQPLRTRILRPHFEPGRLCIFAEDDAPSTAHFGLFDPAEDNACVAAVTFLPRHAPDAPDVAALQLRGMCVAESMQGKGLGARLFESTLAPLALLYPDAALVWCNARISAAQFYEKLGFERRGEVFEVDRIGPHIVMRRDLNPALAAG